MLAPGRYKGSVENKRKEFSRNLLEWWTDNKRDFPWRKTNVPYEILIAELLLRKTTAKQVATVFGKFLSRYPDPKALSRASEKRVESIIRSLGMERKRSGLLKSVGREIVQKFSGQVPVSREDLLSLPGVGPYAANAVLCFAYGEDAPLVDTNSVRIFSRVFGFKSGRRRPKDDPDLWQFVRETLPKGNSRDFNLAVIDLAHMRCLPTNPDCGRCPAAQVCSHIEK